MKILQRTANLDGTSVNAGPPPEQAPLKKRGGSAAYNGQVGWWLFGRTFRWTSQRKRNCLALIGPAMLDVRDCTDCLVYRCVDDPFFFEVCRAD